MEVHVALDIYKNRVVRMAGGRPDSVIVYAEDPLGFGLRLLDLGVKRLHVVDLEAAIESGVLGERVLRLAATLRECGAFVTLAGGVRSREMLSKALESADRVVLGTAIHKKLVGLEELAGVDVDRVVLALDSRKGRVLVSGWREELSLSLSEALELYSKKRLGLFLVTDAARDGTLAGVDRGMLEGIPAGFRNRVIYAGGVSSSSDLKLVAGMGFRGVVVGRAFYEGLVSVEDLLEAERA